MTSYLNEFSGVSDLPLVDILNFDIGGQDDPNLRQVTIKEINLTALAEGNECLACEG